MRQRSLTHLAAPPEQGERQQRASPNLRQAHAPHVAEGMCKRRCAGAHSLIYFPPPPAYPPPFFPKMANEVISLPGPSTQADSSLLRHCDYSYAYYEPGPPTKHNNVPSKYPGTYREGSYRTRHTYTTRYGTEENIYEEISDMERARLGAQRHQDSIISLNQSLVEEEVRRVHCGHRRVLGELNLSVEAMLMPSESREGSDFMDREAEDQLADLAVGPTDELLSPVPMADLDSGFSGSSSGTSYRSTAGSLRRGPEKSKSGTGNAVVVKDAEGGSSDIITGSKSFWGKKAWRKLAAFPSNISLNKEGGDGSGTSKDESRASATGWEETTTCDHRNSLPHQQFFHSRRAPQRSLGDSWCSGSEPELTSDEESERSNNSSSRNGQVRNTLSKARTICDKWRNSISGPNQNIRLSNEIVSNASEPMDISPQGRLFRWFSIRRSGAHHYDIEGTDSNSSPPPSRNNKMPLLPEVEDETLFYFSGCQRRQVPPSMPPAPPNLSQQQAKRRVIVAAIVHSENSYIATLQRLVNDYKKPLEESNPPILNSLKISTLFHRLSEILQCHTLFRIALAECIRNWDKDEKIGDVFVASFSKAIVLDIYSGFINNFSVAMDLAKTEAKRKSALADFFKVKQISSHDRLSFFGLMVKPVQRFPQFILFLQDLLKHTPHGHHDRMSLQLALTQLESLAEMLNERKRESEQYQAFKWMLSNISGKFTIRPLHDSNRYLLREDNVLQLEYNPNGILTKAKNRRLLLLNDLVVCVSGACKSSDDFGQSGRLNLKWSYPVSDVEIQDTSLSPTLSRILTSSHPRGSSIKSNRSFDRNQSQDANNLCIEMSSLMHDYEVMSRITDLVGSLKGNYSEINVPQMRNTLHQIQSYIQEKDEEMAWMDSCCLQLVIKTKGKEEVFTFQIENPSIKKEWITELRLAQLALDPNNAPAWEIPEQEQRPSTKLPLFVKAQQVFSSQHQTEVRCGCYYTMCLPKTARRHLQNYLWICTTDGASSHITILTQHHQQTGVLKDLISFSLLETQITAMEFVHGSKSPCPNLATDLVWVGTDRHKIHLYAADVPEKQEQIANITVPDVILQIKNHCGNVFVALANGSLLLYRKNSMDNSWILNEPQVLNLGSDLVACLLPINICIYAACGKKVYVINGCTGEIQKSFTIQHDQMGNVNLMAHSGIGLWISQKNSSTICLYHTETFKHLQDINIASIVLRVCGPTYASDMLNTTNSRIFVTSLLACKGLLWVGTNVGRVLTIPLPRLEGVPIISGRVNISYHAHFGPISFLLALNTRNSNQSSKQEKIFDNTNLDDSLTDNKDKKQLEPRQSDASIQNISTKLKNCSPIVIKQRKSKADADNMSRISKTLPRSMGNGGSIFSTTSACSQSSSDTCNVYGLYGNLIYLKDYEKEEHILNDTVYEPLRRSDPELAAIPNKVSTLDRRLKMKSSRPRSLDISNWSVDSRSSSLCTSSGSEESMAVRYLGQSVSRNNSNTSRQLNYVCENSRSHPESEKMIYKNPKAKPLSQIKGNNTVDNGRRTIITLMGGRGYVNCRQPCCSADKAKHNHIKKANSIDAHIVIWELKL